MFSTSLHSRDDLVNRLRTLAYILENKSSSEDVFRLQMDIVAVSKKHFDIVDSVNEEMKRLNLEEEK